MKNKDISIAVIGLGYVGLPLANELSKNFNTTGFDINVKKIKDLFIPKDTLKKAYDGLKKDQKKALNIAADRIKQFHKQQIPKNFNYRDNLKINLGLKHSPINSAGFYVPGGKAIYPSSVLMNAIPALVSGVERRVLVSPISDLNKFSTM